MKDNPFTSDIFTTIWLKHFYSGKSGFNFDFIQGLSFVKFSLFPIFINVGKNHTKGIDYTLSQQGWQDYKNKVFLIYDVPNYFRIITNTRNHKLKEYIVKQYPGYIIDLEPYKDVDHYLDSTHSKNSRRNLKRYRNKLEKTGDIHYKMYFGQISRRQYDFIFDHFRKLLERRFLDKQIRNNNLDIKEWNFYYEVAYPMILEKKASLYVICDAEKPIGVTLNYISDDTLFCAITVFDIDYRKFHLGSLMVLKITQWCFENRIKVLDFSKGYYEYKTRWATKEYDFNYHILYNSSSLYSNCIAFCLKLIFKLKQFLRAKGINELFHKYTFYFKRKTKVFNKFSLMFLII